LRIDVVSQRSCSLMRDELKDRHDQSG